MKFLEELQQACGYDPEEDGSVDDLIGYKDALEGAYASAAELVEKAATVLVLACNADDDYWEQLACGQDSDEAESSGYLIGYRHALQAVVALLSDGDPKLLGSYTEEATENAMEQRREMGATTDALDDPSDAEVRL